MRSASEWWRIFSLRTVCSCDQGVKQSYSSLANRGQCLRMHRRCDLVRYEYGCASQLLWPVFVPQIMSRVQMRTTLYIPGPVFDEAEALAARLGITRSRLYAAALAEYLATLRSETETARKSVGRARSPRGVDDW